MLRKTRAAGWPGVTRAPASMRPQRNAAENRAAIRPAAMARIRFNEAAA